MFCTNLKEPQFLIITQAEKILVLKKFIQQVRCKFSMTEIKII